MKVMLVNGSPHMKGCTFTALSEVAKALEECGVDTEIVHIGADTRGCIACGKCRETGKCVFDDSVNRLADKLAAADGLVFGAPVYYASVASGMKGFMDRLFYSHGASLRGKPAAAVVNARRGGCSATFDELNKYFTINSMPVAPSQYWNMTHGCTPEETKQDLEGMQTMRTLGRNMAWMVKCFDLGKQNGIVMPEREPAIFTNFIR